MNFWSWFPYSLTAVCLFGVSTALYKLPSVKGYSRSSTTFWILLSSFVLAFLFFHQQISGISGKTILLSILWGVGFTTITLLQMYALSHVDTNTLFPITTTLSLVVTVIVGLFMFHDSLSFWQGIGILVAILSVYLFLYKKGKFQYVPLVLLLLSSITFISAFNKIIQKLAADTVDIHAFQFYQYIFGTIFALLVVLVTKKTSLRKLLFSGSMVWGIINGILGFFGGWALLVALTKGPFTLITTIHSMYIFVTALFGFVVFREKIDRKKWILIGLSVVAVMLMKLH